MKSIKSILILSILTFFMTSCSQDGTTDTNTDESTVSDINHTEVAIELCKCMQPLVDLNKEIQVFIRTGQIDKIQEFTPELERLSKESEACASKLDGKYGVIKGADGKAVNAAMEEACPDITNMLNRANRQEAPRE